MALCNYDKQILTKASISDSVYYWASGKKIYLSIVPDKYFVVFDKSIQSEKESQVSFINTTEIKSRSVDCQGAIDTYFMAVADANVVDAYSSDILYYAPYVSNGSKELGLTEFFYVKLKSDSDRVLLNMFAEENNVKIVEENFLPLWYKLECTEKSKGNSLDLSNFAYESGMFSATDVSFYGDMSIEELVYNDAYFNQQWNLTGTYGISYDGVPQITTGTSSVKVAIIDSGIRLNHPDLPITESWDAMTETSPGRIYPASDSSERHGTAMTGIIGATQNNNIGIVGIAPDVSLLPISLNMKLYGIEDYLSVALKYATDEGARVISNSWSYDSDHNVLNEAFEYALDHGCVVVQSSGNLNSTIPKYPYWNYPDVIVVGNIEEDGKRHVHPSKTNVGSNYGSYLDIVAPGTLIPSLSVSSDYCNTTGTSPACAHISAVAALILSVNPDLTRQDVAAILEKTARKLPDYDFAIVTDRPYGTWNDEVGYGLVDCYDAVVMAQELDRDNYNDLVEFDYSGTYISLEITAAKDVAVIWNWGAQDISYIAAGTTEQVSHTYPESSVNHIVIAECLESGNGSIRLSTALKKFELETGEKAYNFIIRNTNKALENITICGGACFATQEIVFSSLTGLKTLQLMEARNTSVTISNCPNLTYFSNTKYVWGAPNMTQPVINDGILSPYVVGDGNVWPICPENVESFACLNISGCAKLHTLSLENVGFCTVNFANLPKLQYVYLTSKSDRIVGALSNPLRVSTKGEYLKDAISTLPSRSGNSAGRVLLRCVSNDNASYVPVNISSSNYNVITSAAVNKNWELVWDSGVEY